MSAPLPCANIVSIDANVEPELAPAFGEDSESLIVELEWTDGVREPCDVDAAGGARPPDCGRGMGEVLLVLRVVIEAGD